MQAAALGAQQIDGVDTDLQVFRDRAFIEAVGLSRQFDLAMQRLVRDTQQGAVRHPEAVALGRDGGALHIDGHGPALVEPQRRFGIAQLPVPVVGRDHSAGAQPPLDLLARHAGNDLGGVIEGALDLGDARNRDVGRQYRVQHMVVAQIGMSEDIVADRLAGTQAAAVADHHPDMRPGDGQVVADRLGVGRPDPDIDQGDAGGVRRGQVVGRHLVLLPGRVHDRRPGIGRVAGDDDAPGADQGLIGAGRVLKLGTGPAHELVDIAIVVGEQDVALHILDRRARVVPQAGEGEVGAQAVELGQREVPAEVEHAVRDLVADIRQVGGREPAGHGRRLAAVEADVRAVHHIRKGNFLMRRANLEGGTIVCLQQAQLFHQIGAEQVGPGDGGRIDARPRQAGVGAGFKVAGPFAKPADPEFRIGEQAFGPGFRISAFAGPQEGRHRSAQVGDGLIVEGFEAVQGRLGCHRFCHGLL